MYTIVKLEELEVWDKVIIVLDGKPRIATVHEIDLDDNSFIIVEGGVNVYLDEIAVLDNNNYEN